MPTSIDLAWAAGFLEGEGTFTPSYRRLRIKAVQVNLEPLYKLQRLFGGNIYLRNAPDQRRQPFGEWIVNGALAEDVARRILVFLSEKRRKQIGTVAGGEGET